MKQLFGNAAVDIQHVGSTAIHSIYAKPIIDIVIGLRDLNDISPYRKRLEEHMMPVRKNRHYNSQMTEEAIQKASRNA